MDTAEYEALTSMNEDLCNALPINDLIPSLISKRVIDFNDKAEICSESNERRRVDMFISKLIGGMKAGNNEKFYKLMEVMKKSPKCAFLVNRMELLISDQAMLTTTTQPAVMVPATSLTTGQKISYPTSKVLFDLGPSSQAVQSTPSDYHNHHHNDVEKMLELQRELFTANTAFLVRNLSPDDIVDQLISHHLVGNSAREQLNSHYKTSSEKNRIIVEEVSSGEPGAVDEFCEILKKNSRTRYIAEKLEKEWETLLSQHSTAHSPLPLAGSVSLPATTHTRTPPSDQGPITPGRDQPASQSYQCSDDIAMPGILLHQSKQATSTGQIPQHLQPAGSQLSQDFVIVADTPQPNLVQDTNYMQGIDTNTGLPPPLIHYDFAQMPSTIVQDTGGSKPSSQSVTNTSSTFNTITQPNEYYTTGLKEDDITLHDEIDQQEGVVTDGKDQNSSDYEEYGSELVEMPHHLSVNQDQSDTSPSVEDEEPSSKELQKDATPPQSASVSSHGIPTGTNNLQASDYVASPSGRNDGTGDYPSTPFKKPLHYDAVSKDKKKDKSSHKDTDVPLHTSDGHQSSSYYHHKDTSSDDKIPSASCKQAEQLGPLSIQDGNDIPLDDPNKLTLQLLNKHVRLQVASKWHDLGVELQLSTERVDIIKHNNPEDAEACCTEMFKTWFKEDTEASWAKLVEALKAKSVGLHVLAKEIEGRFVSGTQDDNMEVGRESKDDGTVVTPSLSYRPLPSSAQPVQQVVPSLTTNGDGESSNSSLPAAGSHNRPTLQQLNDHVRRQAAVKWYDLGVELLSADKIEVIKQDHSGSVETCCRQLFTQWLSEDTEASWGKLVDALKAPSVELPELANEIEKKFVASTLTGSQDVDDDHDRACFVESRDDSTIVSSPTSQKSQQPAHGDHLLEYNETVQPGKSEESVEVVKADQPNILGEAEQPVESAPFEDIDDNNTPNPSPPISLVHAYTCEFTKLAVTIQKHVSNHPVNDICSVLLNDANTAKGIPCTPTLENELKKSKSVEDIFATLKKYPTHWNLLNFEVFKKLTSNNQELIQALDDYTDAVSILKVNDINFPAIAYDEKFYTPINVTVDVDPSSIIIGDLFEYQSQLANFLSVDRSALILVEVSTGSLHLIFVIGSVILFGLYNLTNLSVHYHRNNEEVTFSFSLQLGSSHSPGAMYNAGASTSSIPFPRMVPTATAAISDHSIFVPPPPPTGHRPRPPPHDHHDVPPLEDNESVQPVKDEKPVEPKIPIKQVEPEQPVKPVHPPVEDDNDDGNPSPPPSPVHVLLSTGDTSVTSAGAGVDGLIWTALTCTAGGLGCFVINGHMNNDDVAAVTGTMCGVTTGALLLLAVHMNRD